jgi:redox-sensitive bicupin YhaK (pirin superfamily)
MEIISYVLEGELAHRDSLGNGSVIRPGDVQRMSAGTGVMHSEYNASEKNPVHFLQIWIEPNERGIPPSYEEKRFEEDAKRGQWRLIASRDGREGSVRLHQDADLYVTRLEAGESLAREIAEGRRAYLHVIRGDATVNGTPLSGGDAIKLQHEREVRIDEARAADILLFDLP